VAPVPARHLWLAREPRRGRRQVGDGRHGDPVGGTVLEELDQPPRDVTAPVAARRPGTHRHCDVHLAARLVQLLRDLHAGLAGAHHEHRPVRELIGPAVVVRVQLPDGPCQPLRCGGHLGPRVGPGRKDDVAGPEGAGVGLGLEVAVGRRQAAHAGAETHGGVDGPGVAPDVVNHLVAGHEPVGVGAVIRHAGQQQREVRCHEAEAVPAVQPRTAELVPAVHDHVLDARLCEPVARRQAGLARPDHERVDALDVLTHAGRA
jgi:hypothetical protein